MIVAPTIVSLREGIEAALVIAIMLSYLRKSNQEDMRKFVLGGATVAVFASIGIALVMGLLWGTFEGPMLAIFEGSVVLIAAVLLTTMIVWMWKAGATVSTEIQESVQITTEKQNWLGLALLSFSLVLREGVELVLFSMALVVQDGVEIYFGVGLGLLLAAGLGIGIYRGSLQISLQSLFKWTSAFLLLVAAGMVAYGIHELQEGGLLLIGPIEIWNINPPQLPDGSYPLLHDKGLIGGLAKAIFGYNGNPSFLEVLGYSAYMMILVGYYILKRRLGSSPRFSQDNQELVKSMAA
ncbi:MAG: FTR1 family protein [Promethearchaeota archaeon]